MVGQRRNLLKYLKDTSIENTEHLLLDSASEVVILSDNISGMCIPYLYGRE